VGHKSGAGRQISSAHPDVRLARLAARQHGMVSRRQLMAIGIDDSGIRRRVVQGRLHRVHQGVYAAGHPTLTTEARWMAAVMACGHGAVLSHLDAAALWRIYKGTGARVHVTVGSSRRAPGLWVHRARRLHPDDLTVKDQIPVTTVARTIVDLTDVLGSDRILRTIREAEFLQLLDLDALNAAVQRAHGRKRLGVLRQAIEAHTPGQIVREELEHRFLELVRQAGLPPPETNVKIKARGRTYEIDCLWREQRVAVELDGRAAHARITAFESDRRKDAALSAIGLRPLRFTWLRVTREPGDVIAELEATLALAA
jgi:predicted transcriptional regulator of viral defense system/very-short-patch-repair endonuclease